MKSFLIYAFFTLTIVFGIIIGTAVAELGLAYFAVVNPHVNWPLQFTNIPPGNQWIISLAMSISGLITCMAPIVIMLNYSINHPRKPKEPTLQKGKQIV